MNFPVLPFCRSIIPEFQFKVEKNFNAKNTLFFKFNNYRLKIDKTPSTDNFIVFGKFGNYWCAVEEVKKIDDNFHHIMGKHFNENMRSVAGVGISLLKWHKETIFCGKCGKKLIFSDAETNAKYCTNCESTYFPRINPAIIIVVKKENSILVTRKEEWKSGRYGLVAGFIEYGENIEEAAIREVFEETGIIIKNIEYVASQFWPFPYQLMIGLKAEYDNGNIVLDSTELAEAKWLKLSEINHNILPPPSSIARFLMKIFVED